VLREGQNMKLEWQEAPDRTSWGAGMHVACIELSKDETADIYVHEDALHLVAPCLRQPADPLREGLMAACEALSLQTGTPRDEFVHWLIGGGLAEMALTHFTAGCAKGKA
jgi:hypothetical protein